MLLFNLEKVIFLKIIRAVIGEGKFNISVRGWLWGEDGDINIAVAVGNRLLLNERLCAVLFFIKKKLHNRYLQFKITIGLASK